MNRVIFKLIRDASEVYIYLTYFEKGVHFRLYISYKTNADLISKLHHSYLKFLPKTKIALPHIYVVRSMSNIANAAPGGEALWQQL